MLRVVGRRLVRFLALALLIALSGCGDPAQEGVPVTKVVPESPDVAHIAWVDQGLFVTVSGLSGSSVAEIDTSTGALTQVAAPTRGDDCSFIRYGALEALGAKDLAVVQNCPKASFFSRLVGLEPETGVVTSLYPQSWLNMVVQSFSGAPGGTPLIASQGSRICNSLVEFTGGTVRRPSVQPADLVPGQGETLESIEAGQEDCTDVGLAEQPAVNVDGELAFASYPGAAGLAGTDRFDALGGVFLRPAGGSNATEIIADIGEVRLQWSPDGQTLAVSGSIDGDDGTYLFDVDTSALTRVSADVAQDLAWSPAGDQLAVLHSGEDPAIFIYETADGS